VGRSGSKSRRENVVLEVLENKSLLFFSAFVLLGYLSRPAMSFADTSFYQGKTITIVQSAEPGGSGDLRTKAVSAALAKHIPGNPTIMMQYMPGGGGLKAANYMFRNARPDGLTIGRVGPGHVQSAVMGDPGVSFDIDQFIYMGSPISRWASVFYTRKELGLTNLEKLQGAAQLRIGAQSVGHPVYVRGRLVAWLLGLKEPRFITGYSAPKMEVAFRQGEIDAQVEDPDDEKIKKEFAHFHIVFNTPNEYRHPHPRFRSLPHVNEFAKTERQQKVLALFQVFRAVGDSYLLPPGTAREQVEILRDAMRKALKDPEFFQRFKASFGVEATPMLPEEQQKLVRGTPRDTEILNVYKMLAGHGALPAR
jgi:tripartite-type tricarboxylate transporter receptor subunit TctC